MHRHHAHWGRVGGLLGTRLLREEGPPTQSFERHRIAINRPGMRAVVHVVVVTFHTEGLREKTMPPRIAPSSSAVKVHQEECPVGEPMTRADGCSVKY
jgi:hypothetical protein